MGDPVLIAYYLSDGAQAAVDRAVRRPAVEAALLGSVSAALAARSQRPVVVVRAPARERRGVA